MDTAEGQKQAVLQFKKAFDKQPKIPFLKLQAFSRKEKPIKPPLVVSKTVVSASKDDAELLRSELWEAMQAKAEGTEKMDKPSPCVDLQAEWVGLVPEQKRTQAASGTDASREAFDLINNNVTTDTTIYYLAGGGLYMAGIPGSRGINSQLYRYSGARVFTMQYRLTPKETVPTLVLDALVGYFHLISPPKGSMHQPVDPKKLVLAAESGGVNLHLAIIQLLKYWREKAKKQGIEHPTIRINGRDVPIEMPAGCALMSAVTDLPLALPAVEKYKHSDWLSTDPPYMQKNFPSDAIWPANPPRGTLQADTTCIVHPLYNPAGCTDWTGAPPIWLACGHELYCDGNRLLAQRLMESGVPTRFLEYEFMPHSFPIVLYNLPQSKHCTKLWGEACRAIGESRTPWQSSCALVKLGKLEITQMSNKLFDISTDEVLRLLRKKRDQIAPWVWEGTAAGLVKL